ncbi:MAG TPA: putative porin, partial [bacterium]|nr:putative porin [bacterium]
MPRPWSARLAAVALALVLVAGPAVAAPFPDVATDHWAYAAVQYLQDKGLVEGYPDGEFKGHRVLTRYEFAIVVARLYDKLVDELGEDGVIAPDVEAIYQRLEGEFARDLSDLRELVAGHDERIGELETAFGGLSTRTDKNENDLKSLLGKVGSVKLSGDLRTRFEAIEPDQDDADPAKRARIRLRLKGEAKVNDDFKATLRLATGGNGEITSTNESLEDSFALDPFQLDQAYLTWAPTNDAGQQSWQILAGKFAPHWESTLITFDSDVNVEGLGENFFRTDDHWRVNLAQLTPARAGFYLVNQVGYKDLVLDGLDVYGTFHYMNDQALWQIRKDTTAQGSTLKNQITWSDFDPESDFTQWE